MTFYQISPSGKQENPYLPRTKIPASPHPQDTRRALAYLHDRGAHFVLLDDKKPLWRGYLKRRPALETVLYAPDLGIIPWSLGSTALDVDRGKPVQLCLFHPPMVVLVSGQVERCHLYYRDTEPRRNGNWTAFGCGGQIRGANGFLRLWHPQSSVELLFALLNNRRSVPVPRRPDPGAAGEETPSARRPGRAVHPERAPAGDRPGGGRGRQPQQRPVRRDALLGLREGEAGRYARLA